MAKNNRDRLIDTFLSRNRNLRTKPPRTPNIANTMSSYRPAKQGTPYRPRKRSSY